MLVALGPHRFEVGPRALVVGLLDRPDGEEARQMAADGADLLAAADPGAVDADVPVVGLLDLADDMTAPDPGTCREEALAIHALAITRGARVVVTRDVRGTRRVADVLAAILSHT